MNNIYEINDYTNEDYEITNALLQKKDDIDILKINDSDVNLDTINLFINGTNIKTLILNRCAINYENQDLMNIDNLFLNDIDCNDYEFFVKFINLNKLEISNISEPFNCYYLRKLEQVQELRINNLKAIHLGGLGYLKELNKLHINNVIIRNWIFITKIPNLKELHISNNYDMGQIPRLGFSVMIDKD